MNPATGKSTNNSAEVAWETSGHQYTTFIIARIAKFDIERSHSFSYFSQMPDLERKLVAVDGWRGVIGAGTREKRQLKDILHSLHGGDPIDVSLRRDHISTMIQQRTNNTQLDWETGILIHAFGDAYAHINSNGWSHKTIPGHWLSGHKPDKISRNWEEYESYCRALYRALTGGNEKYSIGELNTFLEQSKYRIYKNKLNEKEVMIDYATGFGFTNEQFDNARRGVDVPQVVSLMKVMESQFYIELPY